MGKNAHPVTQNSEPVKSVAETIKEAKEAASYFDNNSNDDIALNPNNKSQLTIHHDNSIAVPKSVRQSCKKARTKPNGNQLLI